LTDLRTGIGVIGIGKEEQTGSGKQHRIQQYACQQQIQEAGLFVQG